MGNPVRALVLALALAPAPARAEGRFVLDDHFNVDRRRDRTDWGALDPLEWTAFDRWRARRLARDASPGWRRALREATTREPMGVALACRSPCRKTRDGGTSSVGFKSYLHEGDEVGTGPGGRLWLFLLDGTLALLHPGTSLSLKEVGVGAGGVLFHVRLNRGHVSWIPRSPYGGGDPELGALVERNDAFAGGRSHRLLLVMPNGSVSLDGGGGEFCHPGPGAPSYARVGAGRASAELLPRGLGDGGGEGTALAPGAWYEVAADGAGAAPFADPGLFERRGRAVGAGPAVLLARELLLAKHGRPVLEDAALGDGGRRLWERSGVRLWSDEELGLRLGFLAGETRRLETEALGRTRRLHVDRGGRVRDARACLRPGGEDSGGEDPS